MEYRKNLRKIRIRRALFWVSGVLILTVLDQLTKVLAREKLAGHPVALIPGVFELYYTENPDSGMGILKGENFLILFVLIAIASLIASLVIDLRLPEGKRYYPMRFCLVLLPAGALGNMIDRVSKKSVTDFFYFSLIDFPIFNVADIYITVSVALLLVLILFVYKE